MKNKKTLPEFKEILKNISTKKLSGITSWDKLMPESHPLKHKHAYLKNLDTTGFTRASVLITIFYDTTTKGLYVPVIQRTIDNYAHSGEIGLPGGRHNQGETFLETSTREAYEEIGISVEKSSIIRELTTLPIPISKHLVHPFVALFAKDITSIDLNIDNREVDNVFFINLQELQNKKVHKIEERIFPSISMNKKFKVPYFLLTATNITEQKKQEKIKIWGATAMILNELSELIK